MIKCIKFTDEKYMTAKEKVAVYKAWVIFLDCGFKQEHFTKALYSHLMQHCGYIAHYNQDGFYETYFQSPIGIQDFFNHFNGYTRQSYRWGAATAADLTETMLEYYDMSAERIKICGQGEIIEKINNLKQLMDGCAEDLKKGDSTAAIALMKKLGY
jgi:hypothetical protein